MNLENSVERLRDAHEKGMHDIMQELKNERDEMQTTLQIFMGRQEQGEQEKQMFMAIAMGAIRLVDATGRVHPIPVMFARSFEVQFAYVNFS
jgi:hypothetical protein